MNQGIKTSNWKLLRAIYYLALSIVQKRLTIFVFSAKLCFSKFSRGESSEPLFLQLVNSNFSHPQNCITFPFHETYELFAVIVCILRISGLLARHLFGWT